MTADAAPSSVPSASQKDAHERMTAIDALRGIAALLVFFPHARKLLDPPAEWASVAPAWMAEFRAISLYGVVGIDIFFVISGFVIAFSLRHSRFSLPIAANFFLRRQIRLDPPYWVAIGVAVALLGLTGREIDPMGLLAHFVYLQNLLGYPELQPVFWTLALEVQFYLTLCVLLLVLPRLPLPRLVKQEPGEAQDIGRLSFGIVVLLAVSLLWPLRLLPEEPFAGWFLPHWHKFLLGVLLWWSVAHVSLRPWVIGGLGVLGVAVALKLSRLAVDGDNSNVHNDLAALVTTGFLAIAAWLGATRRWLRWRPILWVGTISYSLYLIHFPVRDVADAFRWQALKRLEVSTGAFVATSLAAWFAALVGAIVAAWVLNVLVERPALRWSKLMKQSPRQTTARGGFFSSRTDPATPTHL